MKNNYTKCIAISEKVAWKIEDLLPDDYQFDFSMPYLPKALTFENELKFLTEQELLDLNHIRAVAYLNIFAFVEEYIIALEVKMASEAIFTQNERLRAILRFSEEEVKHQTLFKLYVDKFHDQFKIKCDLLGGADEVANIILSNSELAVNILTYHLELITQQHYTESVKGDVTLEPHFTNILQKHWIEESQHAKLDLYEIERLTDEIDEEEKLQSIEEYFGILDSLSQLLKKQTEYNYENLKKCSGKEWSKEEKELFLNVQHFSYVNNFVLMGLKNKSFLKEIEKFSLGCFEAVNEKIKELEGMFAEVQHAA